MQDLAGAVLGDIAGAVGWGIAAEALEAGGGLRVTEGARRLVVAGPAGLRAEWCRATGDLVVFEREGIALLVAGPEGGGLRQAVWRAHTCNDNGTPPPLVLSGHAASLTPY